MKNIHIFLLTLLLALALIVSPVSALETVRVGLYYDVALRTNATISSASLSNQEGFSVYIQLAENVALPLTYTQVKLEAKNSQYVQIGASQNFEGAYQQAREARDKWAYKAYVAYRKDNTQFPFKVWVEGLDAVVRINYPGAFSVSSQNDAVTLSDGQNKEVGLITADRVSLQLSPRGVIPTTAAAPGQFTRFYEGTFEVRAAALKLSLINILNMEQYIFGVVPYEMSDSWPLEALKAQAVAARSFAVANQNKHTALGFNLSDSSLCCQKYAGYNHEYMNTLRAVQETAGLVARYNGSIAQLFYHSNSGGHTENSEDVWSGALPYARATPDPFSVSQPLLVHLASRSGNNTEFPARWHLTHSREEVEEMLRQNQIAVGTVLEILPQLQSAGGRHLQLLVRGTNGEAVILRTATRTVFNFSSSLYDIIPVHRRVHVAGSGGAVREIPVNQQIFAAAAVGSVPAARTSQNISMLGAQRSRTVSKLPLAFAFDGRGWGHGVGMSQWGAFEMARQGYNYEEILKYYFQGIEIGSL